jgi:N-acetylmuramoyl-L-alanine amidase
MAKLVVYLDAGHGEGANGKYDPGAVGPEGTRENEIAVAVVRRIGHLLRERKVTTLGAALAEAPDRENFKEAARAANEANADIFVSIHCNAARDRSAGGFEVLYSSREGWSLATQISRSIAQDVTRGKSTWLTAPVDIKPRGVKERRDLHVLNATSMPAVLVELAFISNPREEALLRDDQVQQAFAQAIADAIVGP